MYLHLNLFITGVTAAVFTVAAIVVILIILIVFSRKRNAGRAAGKAGEKYASRVIRSVLRGGDRLYTNVAVSYDGKPTELDNVIVNKNGVFIIEVKYYSGRLYGKEDDFEWSKRHKSRGGNVYVKKVKNPVKQVGRQVYILSHYLRASDADVWVDGYAIILGAKSPVKSRVILNNTRAIDRVIHTPGKKKLNTGTLDKVCRILDKR